jgi:acetate kinase
LDAIVFTGGIGENATAVREKICASMEPLGIEVDRSKNEQASRQERRIDAGRGVAILVIPTDEEGVIAADTYQLASQ